MTHEIIDVTLQNIDDIDLFCKKTKQKEQGYKDKLTWVRSQLVHGLRIKILMVTESGKATSRGFIEYMPGEHCWRGIEAKGWFVIHCLWVVGRYKEHGFGSELLATCMNDARRSGACGVCVMVTSKKGWLPGPKLFVKSNFKKVDEYPPVHELLAWTLDNAAPAPRFIQPHPANLQSFKGKVAVFNACQCPYVDNIIKEIEDSGVPFEVVSIKDAKQSREDGVHPYGTCNVVVDGKVVWYNKAGVFKAAALAMNTKKTDH